MNDLGNEHKEMKQKLAEERLNHIDVLFAAFGPFISALFCIAQYFFDGTTYFTMIAVSLYGLILAVTYYLAVSNKQKKNERFWEHVKKHATAVGPLNPVVLAVGILLAIVRNIWVLIMCVIFVVAQVVLYIIAGRKQKTKVE